MKIICPFCKSELDSKDDVPTETKTAIGGKYICHKVFCNNINAHPDHNTIAVVFNPKQLKSA